MYKYFSLFIGFAIFMENLFQFIALLSLLMLVILLFYMLFTLGNSNALDCISSFINGSLAYLLVLTGRENLSPIQEQIFGMCIISLIFFVCQFLKMRCADLVSFLKVSKENCRRYEDDCVNKDIHRSVMKANKKISKYLVYIELKKKHGTIETVNLDVQYKLLNEFLTNKTGVNPVNYGDGFLYKFDDIEKVDNNIKYLIKAMSSKAPVDYKIILQVVENGENNAYLDIYKLKNTELYNTILMSPTSCVRYEHNEVQTYITGIVGNYIINGEDISIYEIRERSF